jgi:transmembrane sensor
VVETGTAKITVLGTRFAVNKLSKLVRVSVDHGRVQIESTSLEGAPVLVLQAGQVAEILPQRAPARMTRNAEDAFGFAQGRLVFDKADLDELAETLSRYHATPLVATGNSPARVTAVININNSGQFIQSLPDIAPVQVVSQPGQTIIRGNK